MTYVEEPFLAHLEKVGWTVERWKGGRGCRTDFGDVILESRAKAAILDLNPWLTDSQADDLVTDLHSFEKISLIDRNREGDDRLAFGLSAYNEETGEDNQPVRLIDYTKPKNNSFLAVSQFRIQRLEKEIIPECKSSTLKEPFFDGVAQIERYKRDFSDLFSYNQFVISTCRQTAKYTTVTGNAENYLEWKEPYPFPLSDIDPAGGIVPSQEKLVWGMLSIENFLDIVRNYTVSLIYMQAKQWAQDRVVGQPEIQSFVGAIAGKHGDGLFVTTAKYSQKAKDYVQTHHIILIDGERLANLMIESNFCVSVRKTFEIKDIDTDVLNEYQDN